MTRDHEGQDPRPAPGGPASQDPPTGDPTRATPVSDVPEAVDTKRRVASDALAVGLGYLASFAYPLVSLPLLARVFGVADLGRFMFALAVLQLVVQFTDFGFGMSALRRIAVARTRVERSRVAFATLAATAGLWLFASTVLMLVVLVVPRLHDQWPIYLIGLLLIGVGAMYPKWLLQGTGRVKAFALLTAISRLVALVLLVITVNSADDVWLAMIWQQFPLALSALSSWAIILWWWKDVHVVRPRAGEALEALRDSTPMFFSNVASIIMGSANSVVLGIVSIPASVAYFSAAERFGNAARGVMRGVVDAMLPRMTRGHADGAGSSALQRMILIGIMGAYLAAGLCLVIFAPLVVPWYLGEDMAPAAGVTQLVGVALMIGGVETALMLKATAEHRYRTVARFALICACVHLTLLFITGTLWGAHGIGCAMIVTETLMGALYTRDALHRRRERRAAQAAAPARLDAADQRADGTQAEQAGPTREADGAQRADGAQAGPAQH